MIVLDDARQHPDRALFPMWCIDGADAYWTMPELRHGRITGALMHKHLPDGPTEVAVAASPGEVVSAPSAAHGTLAYELVSDRSPTHVAVRWNDGTFRAFPDPSSGPSVGEGFVALKAGPPDVDAPIITLWPDGRTTPLGNGQRAVAGGPWVAWGSKRRDPDNPQGIFPVFVSRPDATCFARFSPPSLSDHQISVSGFTGDVAAAVVTDTTGPSLHQALLLVRLTLSC